MACTFELPGFLATVLTGTMGKIVIASLTVLMNEFLLRAFMIMLRTGMCF